MSTFLEGCSGPHQRSQRQQPSAGAKKISLGWITHKTTPNYLCVKFSQKVRIPHSNRLWMCFIWMPALKPFFSHINCLLSHFMWSSHKQRGFYIQTAYGCVSCKGQLWSLFPHINRLPSLSMQGFQKQSDTHKNRIGRQSMWSRSWDQNSLEQ